MRQQQVKTIRYGFKTALYHNPQLWFLVPTDLKSEHLTLSFYKNEKQRFAASIMNV